MKGKGSRVVEVVLAKRALMCQLNLKYIIILQGSCDNFHVPLELCINEGFYVPLESYIYYLSCLLSGFPCTTGVMYAKRAFMYYSSHKYTTLQVCCKGFGVPLESCMR